MTVATAAPRKKTNKTASDIGGGVVLDVAYLMGKCAMLERELPNVAADDMAAEKPGGLSNSDLTANGWLYYYSQLNQWLGEGKKQQGAAQSARWSASEMEDLRNALAQEPLYLRLQDERTVGAYPKSDYALNRMAVIDRQLQWLLPQRVAVEAESVDPLNDEMLRKVLAFQTQLEREWIWILTHPGPDVPWPDDGEWEHAPPAWTRSIGGHDLYRLRRAHLDVNVLRLNVIAERTHAMAGTSSNDMPKELFMGVMATELNRSAAELSRLWSTGMIYAQAYARGEASRQAEARAKAEAR